MSYFDGTSQTNAYNPYEIIVVVTYTLGMLYITRYCDISLAALEQIVSFQLH